MKLFTETLDLCFANGHGFDGFLGLGGQSDHDLDFVPGPDHVVVRAIA